MKLPLILRNSISLNIRKHIKEYVFKIFKSLSNLYPNLIALKNDVFLNSLINDINSLKSFLNSIRQNTNSNYRSSMNSNIIINRINSNQNKIRKERGGRYKNDFKNSILFKKNNRNINNFNNYYNEINNTDYSDNFEECKIYKRRKNSMNRSRNFELNLSLNEFNDNDDEEFDKKNFSIDNISNVGNLDKKSIKRRKFLNNGKSLKVSFDISCFEKSITETNDNIIKYDNNNIIILKSLLDNYQDSVDRLIIDKNKLDHEVLSTLFT